MERCADKECNKWVQDFDNRCIAFRRIKDCLMSKAEADKGHAVLSSSTTLLGALAAQIEKWSLAADYADSKGKNAKQRNRSDGLSYGLRKCVKELNAIISTGI